MDRQSPLRWVPGPRLTHAPVQGAFPFPNRPLGSPNLGHVAPLKGWLHPAWKCPSRSHRLLSDTPRPPPSKTNPAQPWSPLLGPVSRRGQRSPPTALRLLHIPLYLRPSLCWPQQLPTATCREKNMERVTVCDQSHRCLRPSLVAPVAPRPLPGKLLSSHRLASTDGPFTQLRAGRS